MIRVIDYRKVDMTDDEWGYYNQLIQNLTDTQTKGEEYFKDLFETDENGVISVVHPNKSIPWVVLFFVQNIMLNQHLREQDRRIERLEKRIDRLNVRK